MRILLDGEQSLRVQAAGEGLEVEPPAAGLHFSPLHMLAASLATCTVSVLASWALQAGLSIDPLEVAISWYYVDDPFRVGRYDVAVRWPGLSPARGDAALRVARHCTVEHTLQHPPIIDMRIER
ncbi:MAG TPA: OsmC family protein [Longimicrobiales bacterium]